ncbi:MAG TPA: HEAT repeat domain-containing protein [Terracidiphilus sp.]|jgi:HEAT repeat protein
MRDLQLRGLSAATKELVYPLVAWPDIQARWRGELDTVSRIRSIGDSGEAHAIPDLISYAFAPNRDVQAEARSAIRRLFERLPLEQLPVLDEALRTAWAHVEDWYGLKPSVKKLKGCDPDDLILLALMSAHRSGYVRAEVIHSLGKHSSETVIPFLLVRLVDWVEAVRRAADLELIDKLQPQYGGMFVRCLGLLERLSEQTRFRPAYREWVSELLKRPACAEQVNAGLDSNQRAVRRACYPIAASNPALNVKSVLDRALVESDVAIRRWAFASGSTLWPGDEIGWTRRAASDAYPPIRQRAFDSLARTEVSSEEISKFLFDRCTGIRRACQALCMERFGIAPVEIYREALTGGNSKRTEIAVRGVAETGSREDGRQLLELLNHRSARVRSAAVYGLGVLKVEQIEEKLLEKISSDSRSVAREATSVLLLRKLVSPGAISAAAKQNPDPQSQLAVLRQIWRAGKWVQLRLYLDSAASDNRELAECALERLAVWESQFNRTFVQPSVGEPAELRVLTHRVESRLPADLAKRITFIVQSFAK